MTSDLMIVSELHRDAESWDYHLGEVDKRISKLAE
jgi:hypothetical protein